MIRWPAIRVPLPLLVKELLEQAARRRTYVVRVVYAACLFTAFAFIYYEAMGSWRVSGARLGQGQEMLRALVAFQTIGIFLFLPALMSTAITREKENRSLTLLLVTAMRPREIVLQKYLGGLIPMFTLLLLSLPLLAISYAFGGIEPLELLSMAGWLFLTCLLVGAVSIMCSAWCRTSVAAFISSYLLSLAIALGSFLLLLALVSFAVPLGLGPTALVLLHCAQCALLITFLLFLATRCLVRRAFVAPGRPYREPAEAAGRRRRRKDGDDPNLPGRRPIAWREGNRRCSYALRNPARSFLVLLLPMAYPVSLIAVFMQAEAAIALLTGLFFVMWVIAALAVIVSSASAIPLERTSQTLDLLLTTPLTGREILHQKLEGVRRLIAVLCSPMLGFLALKGIAESRYYHPDYAAGAALLVHFGASLLTLAILLPLFSWLAVWISLKTRTRLRAVLIALGVVVAWSVAPWVAGGVLAETNVLTWRQQGLIAAFSPTMAVVLAALAGFDNWLEFGSPAPLFISLAVCGAVLYTVRTVCLRKADAYLGRATMSLEGAAS